MGIFGEVELMDDDRRAWKVGGTIVGAPSIAQKTAVEEEPRCRHDGESGTRGQSVVVGRCSGTRHAMADVR
jgi:hypothetical protein